MADLTKTPKIALEEHFMEESFIDYFNTTSINISPQLFGKALDVLQDFGARRLESMDVIGIEKSVLSLAGPGVQAEKRTDTAVRKAREVNDFLAEKMAAQPDRYGGLGHIAL